MCHPRVPVPTPPNPQPRDHPTGKGRAGDFIHPMSPHAFPLSCLLSPSATHTTQPRLSWPWRAPQWHPEGTQRAPLASCRPWLCAGAAPSPQAHRGPASPTVHTPSSHSITPAPTEPLPGGRACCLITGAGFPHPASPRCVPLPCSITHPLHAVQGPVLTLPVRCFPAGADRGGGWQHGDRGHR